MKTTRKRRALVVGASLAGLFAAQVLHEIYDQVIVIDRDTLPEQPQPRRGVPQSGQVHGLLARGIQAMDGLFEGLSSELISLGALSCDVQEFEWWGDGRPLAKGRSGMTALSASRPLIESTVRRRVSALPNVQILTDRAVTGLLTAQDDALVTGVATVSGCGDLAVVNDVDLVVDASGRGSRARQWLTQLGYPEVEEERIEIQVTYVTRRYRREPHHLDGRYGAAVGSYPDMPRGGFVLAQEDDTWIANVNGWFGDVPPADDAGMLAWAQALDCPDVATIMRTATPISDPVKMRYPASSRLRYDRVNRFPSGFLVLGDAMCSFNPIYGQGITVAALEAALLGRLIPSGTDDMANRFFAEATGIIDVPWAMVMANDLRFPQTIGNRSGLDRQRGKYLLRLRAAAAEDPELAGAFLRVVHLVEPPASLFAPEITAKVGAFEAGHR